MSLENPQNYDVNTGDRMAFVSVKFEITCHHVTIIIYDLIQSNIRVNKESIMQRLREDLADFGSICSDKHCENNTISYDKDSKEMYYLKIDWSAKLGKYVYPKLYTKHKIESEAKQ